MLTSIATKSANTSTFQSYPIPSKLSHVHETAKRNFFDPITSHLRNPSEGGKIMQAAKMYMQDYL